MWAAGLSVEDTQEGLADGMLAEDGLRLLAGLRGFRLPSADEWAAIVAAARTRPADVSVPAELMPSSGWA